MITHTNGPWRHSQSDHLQQQGYDAAMTHKIVVIEGGKREGLSVPEKPVENTAWMLDWCRRMIPNFRDMHDRALASKGNKP